MLLKTISTLFWLLLASRAQDVPIVDLGYATYQGVFDSGLTGFKGMRYAAPPTGSLRWQAPETPETVSGVQNATKLGPACLQASSGVAASNPFTGNGSIVSVPSGGLPPDDGTSEDCLYLSVYTPGNFNAKNVTKLLPVVFWIHGGGYIGGNGGDRGDDLVRESGYGVVAVVIQYRLGLFGFLAGQDVKDHGSLNAGLLDQHFALKWAQEHVSKFGGDPTRVTIWGESAGAGSVLQQVVANDGETSPPLFRAAITSSTFLPSQYHYNDGIPEQIYSSVVDALNCTSSEDALDCLRKSDVDDLQAANVALSHDGFFGTFVFVPVVDETFIVRRPTETLRMGKTNGNVYLAVTNTDEGGPFVDTSTADTVVAADYLAKLFPKLSRTNIKAATLLYSNVGTALDQAIAIMNESIFVCPSYYMLRAFGAHAYKGQFAIPPATHGQDILYYFPSFGAPAYADPDFIKAFAESFTAFIADLDPNDTFEPTITPAWPKLRMEDLSFIRYLS